MTQEEQAKWLVGLRHEPVWRDGLSSSMSYLIFAVRKTDQLYNCVCARKLDVDDWKVKFYPDYAHWGVTLDQLKELGARSFRDRTGAGDSGYIRFHLNRRGLNSLITLLNGLRNVTAIPAQFVLPAYDTHAGAQSSRVVHPITGGGTPRTPWQNLSLGGPPAALAIDAPKDQPYNSGVD